MPRTTRKKTSKASRRKKAPARKKATGTRKKTAGRKKATRKGGAGRKKTAKRKYSRKAGRKVHKVMDEFKKGELKSGRSGRKVKSRKQAIAIGISEARKEGDKVPPNPNE